MIHVFCTYYLIAEIVCTWRVYLRLWEAGSGHADSIAMSATLTWDRRMSHVVLWSLTSICIAVAIVNHASNIVTCGTETAASGMQDVATGRSGRWRRALWTQPRLSCNRKNSTTNTLWKTKRVILKFRVEIENIFSLWCKNVRNVYWFNLSVLLNYSDNINNK